MNRAPTSPEISPSPPERPHIDISVGQQFLRLSQGANLLFEAPISSATKGIGYTEGSHQTPIGRFFIREKIGDGAPLHTAFLGRRPTGIWSPTSTCHDSILTRIMWLDGLDEKNANTYRRYIYLHGTHAEDSIGQPASLGCIRLRNADMLRLFDLTPLCTTVTIHES